MKLSSYQSNGTTYNTVIVDDTHYHRPDVPDEIIETIQEGTYTVTETFEFSKIDRRKRAWTEKPIKKGTTFTVRFLKSRKPSPSTGIRDLEFIIEKRGEYQTTGIKSRWKDTTRFRELYAKLEPVKESTWDFIKRNYEEFEINDMLKAACDTGKLSLDDVLKLHQIIQNRYDKEEEQWEKKRNQVNRQ